MAIQYTLSAEGDLLRVGASGRDENLAQVEAYGRAVLESARTSGCTRIFCDETGLVYELGTLDTYRSAEAIAAAAPNVSRVAILCSPAFLRDGKFWETVAVNRGLQVRGFTDRGEAEAWVVQP